MITIHHTTAAIGLLATVPMLAASAWADEPEGARPYGMGSAFVAQADDGSALRVNPAGLVTAVAGDAPRTVIQFDYGDGQLADASGSDYALTGVSRGSDFGYGVGIGCQQGVVGDSDTDRCALIWGGAYKLHPRLSFGASGETISAKSDRRDNAKLDDWAGYAGLRWQAVDTQLQLSDSALGLQLALAGSYGSGADGEWPARYNQPQQPLNLRPQRFSAGGHLALLAMNQSFNWQLLVNGDWQRLDYKRADQPATRVETFNSGLEWQWLNVGGAELNLALRAGISHTLEGPEVSADATVPSYGIGLRWQALALDLGYRQSDLGEKQAEQVRATFSVLM